MSNPAVVLAASCLLMGAGAAAAAQQPRTAYPDVILAGGKIFTADSTRPWAQAVAIAGDRIVAVGQTVDVAELAGPDTRVIPLDGRVVVPGFNDAHDHVGDAEYGVTFTVGKSPTSDPTLAEVVESLRHAARRNPRGTWLHAVVGPRLLGYGAAGRAALDRAAPDDPVLLTVWTGHGAVLSSAALATLGVKADVRDPVGGSYERDKAGRLTGVLQEYAWWAVERRLNSALSTQSLVASLRRWADADVKLGITSVQDMNGYLDPEATLRVFRQAKLPLRLRVIPYPMTGPDGLHGAEWGGIDATPAPNVVVSGVKWILDGTPIERGALMRHSYADRPHWHGRLEFPVDTVRAILANALASHEPLHLHVVGDSTASLVLSLMQSLAPDSVWRPMRVRFEHGDGVAGSMLPIVRRLGIVIVQNPSHFAFAPGLLEHRFGHRPAGFQPMKSLLAAGIPLGIGSDGARNPFLNIMLATTHPNDPREALTREQAVTAYTRGSAYAESAEHEKGTLAPGMLADLAVLSQDIFTVPARALPATTSVLTMVGGQIVYDKRKAAKR
jgi:predicted amidohydrolase YtcJ